MSAAPGPQRRPRTGPLLAATAYAGAIALVVWVTLRPVWLTPLGPPGRFDAVVASGLAIGVAAGAVVVLARRGPVIGVLLAAAGYLAGALLVAVPGAVRAVGAGDLGAFATSVVDALVAPVTGWKDVVTLEAPLGEFGATLAVPLVLVVGASAAIVRVGSDERRWPFAAAVGGSATILAIAIGPAARTGLEQLPWPLSLLSREMVVGLVALAVTHGWVLWRMADLRRRALAAAGGGVRGERAPGRVAGRTVVSAALIGTAVVVATAAAVPIGASQPRDVGRTAIEPLLVVERAVTPLTAYRAYLADALYDVPLFLVTDVSGEPDRVRIATLPYFDGNAFTAVAPTGYAPLRFRRVPAAIPLDGSHVAVTVTVEALEGPWAPVPGELGALTAGGPRAAALVDALHYSPTAASAIVSIDGGLAAGDTFTATSAAPAPRGLAEAGPSPGTATVDATLIPISLRSWVERQGVTRDGAGLATLIDRLRSRGYLSHALTVDGVPRWIADMRGYDFEPSMAGHSFDRIDRLFTALLDRELESPPGAAPSALVAAVGDDEQFAAAAALLAAELGFPSRVVVGARLAATDARGWAAGPCEGGVCRGRHLTAWTEVQAASGDWIAMDVTPQHRLPVTPSVATQRDPALPTELDPNRADAVDAVASLKGRSGGTAPPAATPDSPWYAGWVGPAAATAGALLLLAAPFAGIAAAKARRRARRRRGGPEAVVQGGWDEYQDTAVDAGLDPLPLATRLEAASAYGTAHGAALAALADRATFAAGGAGRREAELAWALVVRERAELLGRRPAWRRLGTRLSTRSLRARRSPTEARVVREEPEGRWRHVAAAPGATVRRQ